MAQNPDLHMNLPDDVIQHIARSFAPELQTQVLALLGQARLEDGTPAPPRLLRCAAFASHGDLAGLQRLVALLATDWRDVVMAGEYERQGTQAVPVRDFHRPMPP